MELTVNGQSHEVAAETLAALLIELDFQGSWLATALNGDLVLSWPADTEGFFLEFATSFPAANWTAVSASPATVGGYNFVTSNVVGEQSFYRLNKP